MSMIRVEIITLHCEQLRAEAVERSRDCCWGMGSMLIMKGENVALAASVHNHEKTARLLAENGLWGRYQRSESESWHSVASSLR